MSITLNLELRDEKTFVNYLRAHAKPSTGISEKNPNTDSLIFYTVLEVRNKEAQRYTKIHDEAVENGENGIDAVMTALMQLLLNYSFVNDNGNQFYMAVNKEKLLFASEILRWGIQQ